MKDMTKYIDIHRENEKTIYKIHFLSQFTVFILLCTRETQINQTCIGSASSELP